MPKLGTPYRIAYDGKNFRSGLTDVSLVVLKPDLSVFSNLSMVEATYSGFIGLYTNNLVTSLTDPEGVYLYRLVSPTEGILDSGSVYLQRPVWSELLSSYLVVGSFGEFIQNKLLTTLRYLLLK